VIEFFMRDIFKNIEGVSSFCASVRPGGASLGEAQFSMFCSLPTYDGPYATVRESTSKSRTFCSGHLFPISQFCR
jgi:hypothetical protein